MCSFLRAEVSAGASTPPPAINAALCQRPARPAGFPAAPAGQNTPRSIRGPAGVPRCRAAAGTGPARSRLIGVRVVVTQIAWDGSLRRRVLDTASLPNAGQWGNPDRADSGRAAAVPGGPGRAGLRHPRRGPRHRRRRGQPGRPAARPGDRDPGGRQPRVSPPRRAGRARRGRQDDRRRRSVRHGASHPARRAPRPQTGPVLGAGRHGPDEQPSRTAPGWPRRGHDHAGHRAGTHRSGTTERPSSRLS